MAAEAVRESEKDWELKEGGGRPGLVEDISYIGDGLVWAG